MNLLRAILHGIDTMSEWIGRLMCWFVVVMFIIICFEIFMRYIFRMPTLWVHETTGFILVIAVMMSGGFTLYHRTHVNVEILYNRLSPRNRAILDLFTWLMFYAFIIILIWQGGELSRLSIARNEHSNTYWRPIMWPFKLMVPIGAVLILLQGLAKTARDLVTAITGKELA
ncbi:MAG: TRAP transporter small permease subunit [Dehalococcoidales bacterium]|nr:TRAP transporter small permease subunit [Dehalococcoidales bacterium]